MSYEELKKHIERLMSDELEILDKKNADYSSSEEEALRNFYMVEKLGICSAETEVLVRMADKFTRIINLLNKQEGAAVSEETVKDTIRDIRNYMGILSALLEDRKTQ